MLKTFIVVEDLLGFRFHEGDLTLCIPINFWIFSGSEVISVDELLIGSGIDELD